MEAANLHIIIWKSPIMHTSGKKIFGTKSKHGWMSTTKTH